MSYQPKNPAIAWMLFALLAIVWGSSFILMKYGLRSFSYSQIGMMRVAIAFWFTVIIAFRRYSKFKWKDLFPLTVVGLMGNAIPYILFPLAVTKLDSGVVGVLNALVPLFTLIIGIIWFKTKVGLPSIIGIILGFAGALWLLLPGLKIDEAKLIYGMYPILATICYAISINTLSAKFKHLDALSITLLSLTTVGIPATLYVFSTDFIHIMQTDDLARINLGYVSIMGVVSTSLAVIIFNHLIKTSGSLFGASVTYAIPIVAIMWGVIDGEPIGIDHFIGMTSILIGVYIVNYRKRLREQKKAPVQIES